MKLLLDENLPKRFKKDFPEHEIYTVADKRWNSKKNGELLGVMTAENFDVLITFDQNLQHQQNFKKYPPAVFVLVAENNTYQILSAPVPSIEIKLEKDFPTGATVIEKEKAAE